MADEVTRQAAKVATIVAVPVVLLACGALAVFVLCIGAFHPANGGGEAAAPPSPRPQATTPVAMPARKLTARQATVCRTLLSQLPHAIRDRTRRPVSTGGEQNAAYGDPAITLACGTTMPSFPPTDGVLQTNNVCWYAAMGPDGSVWTTLDREVPVTVTVPAGYEQAAQWVIDFAGPITAAVPSATAPHGCG